MRPTALAQVLLQMDRLHPAGETELLTPEHQKVVMPT